MGKLFLKAVMCGAGAVIGWILIEPSMPSDVASRDWAGKEQLMVFLVSVLIGIAAGAFTGIQRGSRRHFLTSMGLGAALGACGGLIGHIMGGMLVAGIYGPDIFVKGGPLPVVISARMVAATPYGLMIGAAIGATNMSFRGVMAGAIGGFGGGLVAGFLFDPVSLFFGPLKMFLAHGNEVGAPGRAALFLLIGFFVGLFTGILDIITRFAWVRLEVGRNEGKEWPIDTAQTTFGRDERALVPLFGDDSVMPLHAVIQKDGGAYVLHDPGTPIGIGMNGMRIPGPVTLKHNDLFQIGTHNLRFLTKGHGSTRGAEQRVVPVQAGPVQQAARVAPAPQPMQMPTVGLGSAGGSSLIAISGPLTGQRFPVGHALEVGREGHGVQLAFDNQASRRHASFATTPAGIALTDLGSTNGTLVNGQRVSSAILKPGDVVQIGATQFRVE